MITRMISVINMHTYTGCNRKSARLAVGITFQPNGIERKMYRRGDSAIYVTA